MTALMLGSLVCACANVMFCQV